MSAIKNDQILIYYHFNKVMKGTGTSFQSPALCQKHGKGNVEMIAWVVVFHWLRVCDYFFFLFCLLPANCFYSFFVWMRLPNWFVYNCLCAL